MRNILVIVFMFTFISSFVGQTTIKGGFAESISASVSIDKNPSIGSGQSFFGLVGVYRPKSFLTTFANVTGSTYGIFAGHQISGKFSGYTVGNKNWKTRHGYYALGSMYSLPIAESIGVSLFAEIGSGTNRFKPHLYTGIFIIVTPKLFTTKKE